MPPRRAERLPECVDGTEGCPCIEGACVGELTCLSNTCVDAGATSNPTTGATTTPAWTPLFAHAAALVTDIGAILAHGSIVAREYGIPAVLGTGNATQRIRSGQIITVDGDAGTVTLA